MTVIAISVAKLDTTTTPLTIVSITAEEMSASVYVKFAIDFSPFLFLDYRSGLATLCCLKKKRKKISSYTLFFMKLYIRTSTISVAKLDTTTSPLTIKSMTAFEISPSSYSGVYAI